MENNLDKLAKEIADDMVKQENVDRAKAFDPATIFIIIQIVIFIFNFLKKKKETSEGIRDFAKNANLIQRTVIKNRLKKHMKENSQNYEVYTTYKDVILKTSLRKIGSMEPENLQPVIEESVKIQNAYLG